jgi:WD40 repeat protein
MGEPKISAGNSWRFDAPVVACAFDRDELCAFGLGDGTLRFVTDDGVVETVEAHKGAMLSLIAHPDGGFLSGGDDGRLVAIDADNNTRELFAANNRWIENVAVSAESGIIACTAGKTAVVLIGEEQVVFPHASTAAGVAFDPKGRRLAVAHYNGASLWWARAAEQQPKLLEWKGSHIAATWSPDGRFLVTSMQENMLHGWRLEDAADMRMSGYPGKVKSWAWDRRGRTLFTAGASRVVGWPFTGRNGPMGRDPIEIGPERDALVHVVAAHPWNDVVAGGTDDGAVWFEWVGDPGANFLMLNGAKVVSLAFSPDGEHLAIGCEDGFAAAVDIA